MSGARPAGELGPFVFGILRPVIVLPASLVAVGGATLDHVLRHEVAHVVRGDARLFAGTQALRAVAWPIIPVWIAVSRVRALIELACDEAALDGASAQERRAYGHTLLDLASANALGGAPAGALPNFGNGLRGRVEALASVRRWPALAQGGIVAGTVLVLAACSGINADGSESGPAATATAHEAFARSEAAHGAADRSAVQRIVRENFGRFRSCYEAGLESNPKLAGSVQARFVVNGDGSVSNVTGEGSSLPDPETISCVLRGFAALSFPAPEDGNASVTYPIFFAPPS